MTQDIRISIRNLYKIFGDDPATALQAVKAGMSKAELLEKHNHVLCLQDINVDIKAGEITVIMGLSGSGKSTLIRHLNRLIEPTAGSILVNGEDVMTYNEEALPPPAPANKCSWVFSKFCAATPPVPLL